MGGVLKSGLVSCPSSSASSPAPSQRAQALTVKQRLTDGIMSLHLSNSAGPFNCEPNEISAHANRVRAAAQCFIHDSIRIFPPSICRLRGPASGQTRSRDPVPPKKPVIRVRATRSFSYLNTEQMSWRPTFESSHTNTPRKTNKQLLILNETDPTCERCRCQSISPDFRGGTSLMKRLGAARKNSEDSQ